MRNKAFLPLMEQILMIAVFAIAAAVCLHGFAMANSISKERSNLDAAVYLAQDTCEILKHTGGDMEKAAGLTGGTADGDTLVIYYDQNKNTTDADSAVYEVVSHRTQAQNGIGQAQVLVSTNGKDLFSLTVAWQEDDHERE